MWTLASACFSFFFSIATRARLSWPHWGLLKFESRVSSIKNGRIRCFRLIQLKLETRVLILEPRYSTEHNTRPLSMINSSIVSYHIVSWCFDVFRGSVRGSSYWGRTGQAAGQSPTKIHPRFSQELGELSPVSDWSDVSQPSAVFLWLGSWDVLRSYDFGLGPRKIFSFQDVVHQWPYGWTCDHEVAGSNHTPACCPPVPRSSACHFSAVG